MRILQWTKKGKRFLTLYLQIIEDLCFPFEQMENKIKYECIKWRRFIGQKTRKLKATALMDDIRFRLWISKEKKKKNFQLNKNQDRHNLYFSLRTFELGEMISIDSSRWIFRPEISLLKPRKMVSNRKHRSQSGIYERK